MARPLTTGSACRLRSSPVPGCSRSRAFLPAVSFVKPSGWVDGHPASSTLILFEGFVDKIVDAVKDNRKLWESTAIIITFDEGGGYK
jgi:phospholipase C